MCLSSCVDRTVGRSCTEGKHLESNPDPLACPVGCLCLATVKQDAVSIVCPLEEQHSGCACQQPKASALGGAATRTRCPASHRRHLGGWTVHFSCYCIRAATPCFWALLDTPRGNVSTRCSSLPVRKGAAQPLLGWLESDSCRSLQLCPPGETLAGEALSPELRRLQSPNVPLLCPVLFSGRSEGRILTARPVCALCPAQQGTAPAGSDSMGL